MIFERQVESDRNTHEIFVRKRIVNDASCYLRNDQVNSPFSVIYFKDKVL